MTEKQAKRQVKKLLRTFTVGSVLHLLADIYAERSAKALRSRDIVLSDRCKQVQHALIVLGMGVDSVRAK